MNFLFNGIFAIGLFFGICVVLGFEFLTDFFGDSIEPSETIIATVLGAAIALAGTLLTIYAAREERLERERDLNEVRILEIHSKVFAILESLIKAYRHIYSGDPRGVIKLTSEDGEFIQIRQPIEDPSDGIAFTYEETATVIRLKQPWMFNLLNNLQGASTQLNFLMSAHLREVKTLQRSAVETGDVRFFGRALASEAELDRMQIMRVQDIESHLRRLLSQALPEARTGHQKIVEYLKEEFRITLSIEFDAELSGGLYPDDSG